MKTYLKPDAIIDFIEKEDVITASPVDNVSDTSDTSSIIGF